MSGFAHPEYLVTTEWLAAHLDDPNVIVLDCTMHLTPDRETSYQMKPGLEDFERSHIKGAQFVNMLRDVFARRSRYPSCGSRQRTSPPRCNVSV
jgi:thiosulfate/3-mercaptopyruvate sulfurtransferase